MVRLSSRSRLTTLVLNNLWDVKEPLALFEKSRIVPGVMVYLIRVVIGLGGWGGWGEIMYGLRRQPEAPSYADVRPHPLVPLQFSY